MRIMQSTWRYLKGRATNFYDECLSSENCKPQTTEYRISEKSIKDIEFVIDFSCINHIKNLHHHKYIEHIGHLSAWTNSFIVVCPKWCNVVPIVHSSWINKGNVWLIESPENFRLREEFFTTESNSIHNNNAIDCLTTNVFQHLLWKNIFVSSLRTSVKQINLGRFSCQCQWSQWIDNKIDPQELYSLEWRYL